jgi:hypothetical protein
MTHETEHASALLTTMPALDACPDLALSQGAHAGTEEQMDSGFLEWCLIWLRVLIWRCAQGAHAVTEEQMAARQAAEAAAAAAEAKLREERGREGSFHQAQQVPAQGSNSATAPFYPIQGSVLQSLRLLSEAAGRPQL